MSNPIIVRRRVQRDFTILPNDVVRDPRLSWKALGLLVYVLSLPDDFRLHLKYLAKQKPTGRDGTRAGLKELEAAGYLTIRRERQSGRFSQVIWDVTDSPAGGFPPASPPRSEKPDTVNPNPVLPASEKPTLPRTGGQQEPIEQEPTTTATGRSPELVRSKNSPAGIDDIPWPPALRGDLERSARKVLSTCPADQRQLVLYEVAGLTERGAVRHPIGLLRKLIERATVGEFVPSAALDYQRKLESDASAAEADIAEKRCRHQQPTPHDREAARAHLALIRQQLGKRPQSHDPKDKS